MLGRALVSRAQRSTSRAFTPVHSPRRRASTPLRRAMVVRCSTDLGFTRDRRLNVRKSGKPDLRGPFQSVAVPDQRCHSASLRAFTPVFDGLDARDRAYGSTSLRAAPRPGHAIASDAFVALFTFQTAHLVPAAHVCTRGLQLCFAHPEPRGGRSAEKRSGACEAPVGHAVTRRVRRLRGALRPMTRDARLSALHRGGFSPGAALPSPA